MLQSPPTSQQSVPQPPRQSGTPHKLWDRLNAVLLHTMLIAVAIVAIFPFWWMVVAATHRSATILDVPPPLMPGTALSLNYQELMQGVPFWRNSLNSMLVATTQTVLVLFFCSLGGYAFAKLPFPGRETLFGLLLVTMMIPNVLGVIPSFMLVKWLNWVDTYLPLIVPGAVSAFGIFWMRQYIAGAIPNDLIDAARVDGAQEFGIYVRVILPLIRPALAALAIMTFMGKWNEFFWPLIVLRSPEKFTLPVGLAGLVSNYGQEIGVQMLGASMAVVPVLVVFLLSARHFMAGLTAGAVKGV